ncbi:MAG TPA: hypothetical protein VHJ58_10940 [Vicinamibacterales bacterium]|nr:hypothetical protein [Vicinamibacterales bacterium]
MDARVCHEPPLPVLGETGEFAQPTAANPSAAPRERMTYTRQM